MTNAANEPAYSGLCTQVVLRKVCSNIIEVAYEPAYSGLCTQVVLSTCTVHGLKDRLTVYICMLHKHMYCML